MGLPGPMGYRGEAGPSGPNGRPGISVYSMEYLTALSLLTGVGLIPCFVPLFLFCWVLFLTFSQDEY